jgi:NADH-quinone oxidoreductase subunit H
MVRIFLLPLLKIVVLLTAVVVSATVMTLFERKVIAWGQRRRPGFIQDASLRRLTDALQMLLNEGITPPRVDRSVFTLAPVVFLVPALIAFAVIPFDRAATFFGYRVQMFIADVNVGLLYLTSVAAIGVYGIVLAGYASNRRPPLLASLRASVQLMSYEAAVTMMLVSLAATAGTLNLIGIVDAQYNAGVWYIFLQPVAFMTLFIGALAATNRAPFDLPEAEPQSGGHRDAYGGTRRALFVLADSTNMIVVSAVATTLFFGGWLRPFPRVAAFGLLGYVPGWIWFLLKTCGLLYIFISIRDTLPRGGYDRLRQLGWKMLVPLGIANLIATAILKVLL